MEKFPTSGEKPQTGNTYRKIGQIGMRYRNASAENGETYWDNINPYFEKNREKNAEIYGACLVEDYGHISGGIGGTFQADRKTAQCIMGSINHQMYNQIEIEYDELENSSQEFAAKYLSDDDTLHLCYGKDYDYKRENRRDYYDELQLSGKYEHFYRIAYAVWCAHQSDELYRYESFSKEELAEEADLFATSILMDGMEDEQEWWQQQIRAKVVPSPAERLVSIEKILRKLKS